MGYIGKTANMADFNKCGGYGYMERLSSPRKKGLTEASPLMIIRIRKRLPSG